MKQWEGKVINVATPSAAAFLSLHNIVFAAITKPMRPMSPISRLTRPRPMKPTRLMSLISLPRLTRQSPTKPTKLPMKLTPRLMKLTLRLLWSKRPFWTMRPTRPFYPIRPMRPVSPRPTSLLQMALPSSFTPSQNIEKSLHVF
jgi:hypothetical protein